MFRNGLEPWHVLVLIVVLVVVFGSKRLPEAARSLGRSARVFKSEIDEMKGDAKSSASTETVAGETVQRTAETTEDDPVRENAPKTDKPSGPGA
jgi:sec-independent protein translocase protein TatA